MIDVTTRRPISVNTEGTGGPYIMVPVDQLAELEALLRTAQVPFWTDSDAISLDGKPAIAVVNLGRGANVNRVQRLLDKAA